MKYVKNLTNVQGFLTHFILALTYGIEGLKYLCKIKKSYEIFYERLDYYSVTI